MAQMGRPRTFDRNEAIRQAMTLFWQHGYESTSLAMLKSNLGNGITAQVFTPRLVQKKRCLRRLSIVI